MRQLRSATSGRSARQNADVGRRKSADRELARAPVGSLLREPPGMLDAAEDVLRLAQEDAAGVGQRHVMTAAIEQRHADRFLELPDLLAERRLRGVQACSRAREAQLVGHRHEIAQVSEFHGSY